MLTSLVLLATLSPVVSPPADACPPSVVRVTNEHGSGPGLRTEGGTGVVVWSAGGHSLVATNHHVVDTGGRLHVYATQAHWCGTARVRRVAPAGDLVLLDVDAALPVAPLYAPAAGPGSPDRGTPVTLWGHPHGVEDPARKAGRVLGYDGSTVKGLDVLLTSVRSEDGDSGGPQFDARGRVVCLSITSAGSTVPARAVRALVDQVLHDGK